MAAALTPVTAPLAPAASGTANSMQAKARAVARDFEAVFLNAMLQPMFTGVDDNGPFGGGPGAGVWRSMLTDQYARSFAASGGIGIADQIYRSLLAVQENNHANGHANSHA